MNIEREYKGVKYELDGRIKYKVPYGVYMTVDNKIYLSDTLLKLYKEYPLEYLRVNHVLGYKIRPCTTNVIVEEVDDRECKCITLRYVVNINDESKFLKVEIYNSHYRGDTYIVEKMVLEVIDYIDKLQKKKKGEMNNGYIEYNI